MNRFKLDSDNPAHALTSHHIYHDYPHFHTHDYWEFMIVTEGSYRHEINGLTLKAGTGSAYLIRPEDCHALFSGGEKAGHLNILIKSEAMLATCAFISPTMIEELKKPRVLAVSLSPHRMKKIDDTCNLLRFGKFEDENGYKLYSQLLMNDIVSMVFEQNILFESDRPKWLNEIIAEMQRPENLAWGVGDVLSRVDYSHAHFAKLFKRYMGMSLVAYLAVVKMNAAHDYLLHSDLPINEIAAELGYDSNSHFNHVFHKHYSMSPSQYRKEKKASGKEKESLKIPPPRTFELRIKKAAEAKLRGLFAWFFICRSSIGFASNHPLSIKQASEGFRARRHRLI